MGGQTPGVACRRGTNGAESLAPGNGLVDAGGPLEATRCIVVALGTHDSQDWGGSSWNSEGQMSAKEPQREPKGGTERSVPLTTATERAGDGETVAARNKELMQTLDDAWNAQDL